MSVGDLHRLNCSRRDFVRIGGLTALGLTLPNGLRQRAAAESSSAKARGCILIWLDGGPSHLDMWDPKPEAPIEVRGPFGTIPTSLPGVGICELLPNTARLAKHWAIIRSMTSPLGEHNFGTHYLLTGYKPSPVLEYPVMGSVVAQLRNDESALPRHVAIPDFRVGGGKLSGQGFLSATARPFAVGGDPGRPDFRVHHLDFYPGLNAERLERRRQFLAQLDDWRRDVESTTATPDPQIEQAYRMTTSAEARQAFALDQEPAAIRQRYGGRSIGQCCLLARRLIERGVPFVTVNNVGWDTHDQVITRLKEGYTGAKIPVGLIPSLDLALSALLEDLNDRGLLDETLVLVMGEFGRTPKINTRGGRDHWPRVFSVFAAGGGIRGGQVVGTSDAVGESPADRPVTPSDLACTVFTLMGIDPAYTLTTPDARPVRVCAEGSVIRELVA